VSPKSLALIGGGIAILAVAVYLFIQVRATPAQAGPDVVAARTPTPITHETSSDMPNAKPPNVTLSRPVPPSPTPTATPPTMPGSGDSSDTTPPDETKVNLKVDNMMELANKAYDRQDFDEATAIATKVLAKDPYNVRMLRIIVSANCIQGDSSVAQQYYNRLPQADRDQMKTRCDRYGVTFKEP
jgi:hypothetical protein